MTIKKYRPSFQFWYEAYDFEKNPKRFIKAIVATYFQVIAMNQAFWESHNEAMAQQQIEMDQENERVQKTARSANQVAINSNEEVRPQQVCGLSVF